MSSAVESRTLRGLCQALVVEQGKQTVVCRASVRLRSVVTVGAGLWAVSTAPTFFIAFQSTDVPCNRKQEVTVVIVKTGLWSVLVGPAFLKLPCRALIASGNTFANQLSMTADVTAEHLVEVGTSVHRHTSVFTKHIYMTLGL